MVGQDAGRELIGGVLQGRGGDDAFSTAVGGGLSAQLVHDPAPVQAEGGRNMAAGARRSNADKSRVYETAAHV